MKKFFKICLCFMLCFIFGIAFIGCGNDVGNNPGEFFPIGGGDKDSGENDNNGGNIVNPYNEAVQAIVDWLAGLGIEYTKEEYEFVPELDAAYLIVSEAQLGLFSADEILIIYEDMPIDIEGFDIEPVACKTVQFVIKITDKV